MRMRDDTTMIITRADVYTHEIPSTSDRAKKKSTGSKKHHVTNGFDSTKKTSNADKGIFAVMMSPGESSPPAQTTISPTSFDTPDQARLVKIIPTPSPSPTTLEKTLQHGDSETPVTPGADVEAIEEATPIVQKAPPISESMAKIERNGFDMDMRKTPDEREEDMCLIDCIYYTQQCCNCTIL